MQNSTYILFFEVEPRNVYLGLKMKILKFPGNQPKYGWKFAKFLNGNSRTNDYIWSLTPGTWLNLFEIIIQEENLELNLLWFDFCHVTLNLTKSCHFWSLLIWRYNLTNRLVRIFYWQQKQTLKTIKLHFYVSSKRNTLWK